MKGMICSLVVLALLPSAALTAVIPKPGSTDSHIQTVDYDAAQLVILKVAFGYSVSVELGADEAIEMVSVGNSAVWQVTTNRNADHLFIKPVQGAVTTNLTVVTDSRVYSFELQAVDEADASLPYLVRFNYEPPSPDPTAAELWAYRLGGDSKLRPLRVTDDGRSTFIDWGHQSDIPAVYMINDRGDEVLVNGLMQNDRYAVYGVAKKLVFKLGRREAFAVRQGGQGGVP